MRSPSTNGRPRITPAASSVAVTALQHEVKSIANHVRSALQAGEVLRGTQAVLDCLQVEIESV